MPNLVIVTGPQAVGKMTVAECLKEKTGCCLMVNHDSIEVSDKIFGFATPEQKEFNGLIREAAFDTAIKFNKDLIFTFVMAYDSEKDWNFVNKLRKRFEESGGELYFVELEADVETRLKRNVTAHRLESKPSKKNVEWSNQDLLKTMEKHRLNSKEGEKVCPNHIKINNTNLSPEEVVDIILKKFSL
ncbi:MAG: AAA family ATPase [Clostridia bacterium]|nr:AAA family ATPase [Clostridia bacterium]